MIDYLAANQAVFWFALGFLLLAIEVVAFAFGSGVLIFGSIGALVAGAVFWAGLLPETWLNGVAVFAVASILSAVLLWKPLKSMQQGAAMGQDRSSDLIGHEFRLDQDISQQNSGTTRYSGIDWRVVIDDDSSMVSIKSGAKVRVSRVDAGVFYVVPG